MIFYQQKILQKSVQIIVTMVRTLFNLRTNSDYQE